MTRLDKAEQQLIARFVDGELGSAERAAFERRVAEDAALRAAVDDLREHRRLVRCADPGAGAAAPVGFSRSVLDRVRRMPARDELVRITEGEGRVAEVVVFARRLVVAAALLLGLALVLGLWTLWPPDSDELSASEAEELRQIDERVRELKAEALEPRRPR